MPQIKPSTTSTSPPLLPTSSDYGGSSSSAACRSATPLPHKSSASHPRPHCSASCSAATMGSPRVEPNYMLAASQPRGRSAFSATRSSAPSTCIEAILHLTSSTARPSPHEWQESIPCRRADERFGEQQTAASWSASVSVDTSRSVLSTPSSSPASSDGIRSRPPVTLSSKSTDSCLAMECFMNVLADGRSSKSRMSSKPPMPRMLP
mmetsp:Transcript_85886/g.171513  ORF Transcript_85886/g.171513 Transcript_85886/m.171513 type:complete len:207 (-) Transcript_85886:1504-2124(-)